MSRLIDVDKLPFEKMEISATSEEWCVRLSDIESAPTVDAVEVVRCKKCKYCLPYTNNTNYCSHYPYRECYVVVEENDYCSYGERKTDA